MPSATRSSAMSVFELKSAALTLIAVVVKTADLVALAAGLQQRLGDTPGMFEHDPVVIDITQLRDSDATIDFHGLAALLRCHGMVPVAVKGGSALQMAAALAAGFAEAPEGQGPGRTPQTTAAAGQAVAAEVAAAAPPPAAEQPAKEAAEEPAAAASSATGVVHATRVVDRPLRSGQQVYARNADLVVMAVVSHGAEVIADGHIHVYGPLRGRAIAGAKGDTTARIFTTCMEPQLISIAGTYRTTDTELPANVLGKPAQVRLDGDRLVIEPLDS